MISYKVMKEVYKSYPKDIKKAIKDGELEIALEYTHAMETLDWILHSNDND